MREQWKDIKGYEGLYQVSDLGNVRSMNYRCTGIVQNLSPGVSNRGYFLVGLSKNGKGKSKTIHRLVAEAFIDNFDNKETVNHIDENKCNNHLINLEWFTRKEQIHHGTRTKRCSIPVYQYYASGDFKEWPSMAEAGRNGYSQGAISNVCLGKANSHQGDFWAKVNV